MTTTTNYNTEPYNKITHKDSESFALILPKQQMQDVSPLLTTRTRNPGVHACIVMPTYNEALNIRRTVNKILLAYTVYLQAIKQLHQQLLPVQLTILVVDDNSPDGTGAIIESLHSVHSNVRLFARSQKDGLGAAYMAGMQYALSQIKADIILEMDADGQHDPADVFRLIEQIENGADFVIGSRYIAGGSVPSSWAFSRKALSQTANLYAKILMHTGGARDCTGGFRAIRSTVLRAIDFSTLQTKGYAFQVSLLDAAVRAGAQVSEVPIAFHERTQGASKMRASDVIKGGVSLFMLRLRNLLTSSRPATMQATRANDSQLQAISAVSLSPQTTHPTLLQKESTQYNEVATPNTHDDAQTNEY